MNDNNWHIGVIKFYDSRKGFGYIASNHCGMNSSVYEQDFYVDSSSFKEESAKADRRLVVFQWEAQGRGKRRAINVRNYSSKSEEDLELALSYYGDYEFVQLKERRVNMFNNLGVKRPQMLPLLKRQIETSPRCSPKEICSIILHLVRKYKTELPEDKRYIFTKDYDNENRTVWDEIFSLLKREEWIELLNALPPVVLYVTDSTIISEWIDGLSVDISDSVRLKDLEYSKRYISEDQISQLNNKIEETVNRHILSIIEENRTKTSLPTIFGSINPHGPTEMERSIREYLPYTSHTFVAEISDCKQQVRINQLKKLVEEYDPAKYDSNSRLDNIIEVFQSIENRDDLCHILSPLIEQKITKHLESKSFSDLSKLLNKTQKDFKEIVISTSTTIKDSVLEYLTESIDKCIESASQYEFERSFENRFASVMDLLSEEDIESFKVECRNKILSCTSVKLLSYAYASDYKWVEEEIANQKISHIISAWDFEAIKSYMSNEYGLENIPKHIKTALAERSFDVIGNELDTPFDGSSKEEHNIWSSPRQNNISFLERLKKICYSNKLKELWKKYIYSLNADDILELYQSELISELPTDVICKVVNNITILDASSKPERWYSIPVFKDVRLKKIFSDPDVDTFDSIAQYLRELAIDKSNIALAVWLVELLSANRPDKTDYYESREWETKFLSRLRNLRASTESNQRLGVLLWAVHLQTTSNRTAMTGVFPWFPPYLQIKIVKRLFQYIEDGKMNFTAHTLYDFLTASEEKLSLPLEIAFSYLKLREDDPQATFTNTHMLTLIEGRDDHPEWIGIREFVEQCHGRWYTEHEDGSKDDWRTPFYNGLLNRSKTSSNLELLVPSRMIDERGTLQSYNNKYYQRIRGIIELNFDKGTYTSSEGGYAIKYSFKDTDRIAVFSLARLYNIHNNLLHSKPSYAIKPDCDEEFCECRLADALSTYDGLPFYWCGNKPCFRSWVRFHTNDEWMNYTILDFMRILNIPTDYVSKSGKSTRFGYFIIFSSFLRSFARFYDHLKCRKCGKLLHPLNLSNFASRSVTEFACNNESCELQGQTVYLNHCFNKPKCNTIIDSRDSKQCPNGQYICPECGGCCSTENFRQRISNLYQVGGVVSPWIESFVRDGRGHWEKNECYCYKCGKKMIFQDGDYVCPDCKVKYDKTSKK